VINRPFQGVIPALVTPFKDNERIDYGAWQLIIDLLIGSGVHGLLVTGADGEFYTLDMEERTVAMRFCRQAIARRVPMHANVGCITTRDTVALALQAQALDVDAIVVSTPYFVMPDQHELVEHYVEVCRAVRMPVIAYNFPRHGGVELAPSSLAQIASQCPNLVGVHDASGSLNQAIAYRKAAKDRELHVFTASDHLFLSGLQAGCAGTVTGSANLCPKLFLDLYAAFHAGDPGRATQLQNLADEWSAVTQVHTFPSVIKEALSMTDLPMGSCRKPVGSLPGEARQKVAALLEKLRASDVLPAVLRGVRA
jgi:4-hydroxy-tetrahydrodipicolinate synthase